LHSDDLKSHIDSTQLNFPTYQQEMAFYYHQAESLQNYIAEAG